MIQAGIIIFVLCKSKLRLKAKHNSPVNDILDFRTGRHLMRLHLWNYYRIQYNVVDSAGFWSSYLALSCVELLSCFVDKASEVWPDCVLAKVTWLRHCGNSIHTGQWARELFTDFTLNQLRSGSRTSKFNCVSQLPICIYGTMWHGKKHLEPIANSDNLGYQKSGDTSSWKEFYALKQVTQLCMRSQGRGATG